MNHCEFHLEAAHVGDCERDISYHSHPVMEWVWLERGDCTVLVENFGRMEMHAGDVCIMPAMLPHTQSKSPGGETVFVLMRLEPFGEEAFPRIVRCGTDPVLRTWFYQLVNLYEEDPKKGTIPLLLQAMWLRFGEWESLANAPALPHPALRQAIEYLNRNLMRSDCSVATTAEASGISTGHLNHLFRQYLGCAPRRYLIEKRLALACRLLKNPYWNVAEVADRAGFADSAYFCRQFKLHYGIQPGSYRRRHDPDLIFGRGSGGEARHGMVPDFYSAAR